jgi:hypothetical protein
MEGFRGQDFPSLNGNERQLILQGELALAASSYYDNLGFLGITAQEAKAVIEYEFNRLPLMQAIQTILQEYRSPK